MKRDKNRLAVIILNNKVRRLEFRLMAYHIFLSPAKIARLGPDGIVL